MEQKYLDETKTSAMSIMCSIVEEKFLVGPLKNMHDNAHGVLQEFVAVAP